MQVIPFESWHIQQIIPQDAQRVPSEHEAALLESSYGLAWTGFSDRPIACAGVVELWPGRAYAWALLDKSAGKHFIAITRAIRDKLNALPYRRIEMAVDEHFEQGHRWAKMLGFNRETTTPMRAYNPDGGNCHLYARIR
jgi:hypothetical protein